MRPTLKFLLPALAASLTLAACGSSSSGTGSSSSSSSTPPAASTPSASATAVKTASNATLGSTVLTDAHGLTLYSLSGESAGKFICASAACTQVWHPLSATGSGTPSGVASLGTLTRPDGTLQVTYKGMPLYTFAQDQPGEAKGQGLKDVGTWSAATVASAGAPATSTGSSSSTPTQTGRSGY
jgi:predicted lipoprotein with Yx(FWY)xxD motif